jgi:parallel beta-helix repeat protein
LDSAGYTLIHDNEITDNWRGILLEASSPNVSIYGNNVTSNEFGIRVFGGGSSFLNVSGNFVANNRGYGVGVTGIGGGSNYAVISRNVIVNNIDGIALGQGSGYNTVIQNSINGNEYGIGMEYSTQNLICSNNIVDNTQQVSIPSGSVNAWNGSYASGGNYWSDYDGTDLLNGQYQNESGSDGVGDSPYIIDANNIDSYPLMHPWASQALSTDINDDGKVNILDITIVAKAFGSKQGEPAYKEAADLDKNGQINIIDISMIAKDFGKTV